MKTSVGTSSGSTRSSNAPTCRTAPARVGHFVRQNAVGELAGDLGARHAFAAANSAAFALVQPHAALFVNIYPQVRLEVKRAPDGGRGLERPQHGAAIEFLNAKARPRVRPLSFDRHAFVVCAARQVPRDKLGLAQPDLCQGRVNDAVALVHQRVVVRLSMPNDE